MSLNDFAIFTIRRSDYRTCFQFMTKNKAVDRMKNTNLMKKWTTMFFKKIVMLSNTQETMTEQHRYFKETKKMSGKRQAIL